MRTRLSDEKRTFWISKLVRARSLDERRDIHHFPNVKIDNLNEKKSTLRDAFTQSIFKIYLVFEIFIQFSGYS